MQDVRNGEEMIKCEGKRQRRAETETNEVEGRTEQGKRGRMVTGAMQEVKKAWRRSKKQKKDELDKIK